MKKNTVRIFSFNFCKKKEPKQLSYNKHKIVSQKPFPMETSCKYPFKPFGMSPNRFQDLRQKSDNPFFNDDAMLMSNQFSNLFPNLKCQASFMADPPVTENMLETSTHIDESIPNEPCQIIVFRAREKSENDKKLEKHEFKIVFHV